MFGFGWVGSCGSGVGPRSSGKRSGVGRRAEQEVQHFPLRRSTKANVRFGAEPLLF